MTQIPAEFTDKSRGIRLQKAMADAGVASRRDCEKLITEGHVEVNGKLVTALPAWVDPAEDHIAVDGKPVARRRDRGTHGDGRGPGHKLYVMLNKPRSVISTTEDPENRQSVTDLVVIPGSPRLYPVGRLDADSNGLILLTNDGDLAQQLTHPSFEIPKQYHVVTSGHMTQQDVDILKQGLFVTPRPHPRTSPRSSPPTAQKGPNRRAAADQVTLLGHSRGKQGAQRTRLEVTITEGQIREIRKLLARLGFKVRRIQRIAIGPLKLKGVAPGDWRMLTSVEVAMLRKAAARGSHKS